MKLMKREKAAIFLGTIAGEVFLEAGRMALSIPLAVKGQAIADCANSMIPALRQGACNLRDVMVVNSQLRNLGIVFLVAELALLLGVVGFWWRYVRK